MEEYVLGISLPLFLIILLSVAVIALYVAIWVIQRFYTKRSIFLSSSKISSSLHIVFIATLGWLLVVLVGYITLLIF